ncbi:aminotransferase class I/II-fold pyridoxal phosphate-dependent enzyme [Gordonia paraffinivorans]|uniref:aminotransferase class I/II-fold pyridoxal phosphate-dependent enzyme n=1 Tax=Gordonia paraffinivorans TaxID=175628 RepID=UPI00242F252B|nr:pyridoxal phosphate-dependent aminotransferase family protein [Gordonia paraffinivorans]
MTDATAMERPAAEERFGVARLLEMADAGGFTYDPPVIDGASDAEIDQGARKVVNFASCSFLGMHVDGEVISEFNDAARVHGLATGGSRMVQGKIQPHADLESALAKVTGHESAMTFASGLLANIGFVTAMTQSSKIARDLLQLEMPRTVFVLDRDSHWSIRKAVEALPYKDQVFYFAHNDPNSLREVLAELDGQLAVVMFESVYSADGSVAPVGDIVDAAEEFGALTFIDDANGFLVYGGADRPFHDEFDAIKRCTFHMVSFSKAVGLEGGGLAASEEFIRAFEYLSGTSAFTATMLPPAAAASTFVMDKLENDRGIVNRYLDRAAQFRQSLIDLGCTLNPTPTYITSVHIGRDDVAEAARQEFLQRGYLVPVFRYPAVKVGQAGLRLMLNANHSDAHIEQFLDVMADVRNRFGF